MSILVFGLSNYYSKSLSNKEKSEENSIKNSRRNDVLKDQKTEKNFSSLIFVVIYFAILVIASLPYKQDSQIFTDWNEIGFTGSAHLCAAILLCFFVPGYGIMLLIKKKFQMNSVLTVLVAYLLSMLITGVIAYIAALSFDVAISQSKHLFVFSYVFLFAVFLILYPAHRLRIPFNLVLSDFNFSVTVFRKFYRYLQKNFSQILVFLSLFTLLIIFTYYLYGGITIGDQWYHQGRALLFLSGSFREAAISHAEHFYPPYQSSIVAALTSLSGTPLVNSYASIAFLNILPVFAFYYFFSAWVPVTLRKSSLLAATLFTLSAGFGWIYLLNLSFTHPIISPLASLESLVDTRSLDIIRASNFIIATAPDFSTGLTYITLPAGFTLLGIIRTNFKSNYLSLAIVAAISVLGIISHDEYYFFIIVSSLLPLIFRMNSKNYLYLGFIIAFVIVYIIELVTPGNYLMLNQIFGLPLLLLVTLFVVILWTVYFLSERLQVRRLKIMFLNKLRKLTSRKGKFNYLTLVLIFLTAYTFLMSLAVLNELPLETIKDQTYQSNLPWYLYPVRMGLVGIFGIAFILSYFFKKFEKEIFVFGIIIIISVVIGPYYDEHRFSKYTMVGLVGFAALMLYTISIRTFNDKPLSNTIFICAVVLFSSFSSLIFIGYNSLILQTQDYIDTQSRRDFPSTSELNLFEFLHNKTSNNPERYNIASFPKEYNLWQDGFMSKIQAFVGTPYDKLIQSPLILNSSTLDSFYRQLEYSDIRFILLPKASIQDEKSVTDPIIFALNYFKRAYESKNYIILQVPPLEPPDSSSKASIALLRNHQDNLLLPKSTNTVILPYNNKSFDFNNGVKYNTAQKERQDKNIILTGTNVADENTLWSKTIPERYVREVEVHFRIISDHDKKSDEVQVKWLDKDKEYSISLSKSGLELYYKQVNSKDLKLLVRNAEVEKMNLLWYSIKIQSLDDSVKIYLNDMPKIQIAKINANDTEGIMKVGLTSHYNNVEFTPPQLTILSSSAQHIYEKNKYFDYYYPLSFLALSKSRYDIFSDNDLSVFSKDMIVMPETVKFDKRYMDYLNAGGKLIVINSNNNFSGNFSQLFSLKSSDNITNIFTKIVTNKTHSTLLNISGLVKSVQMRPSPNTNVIASYRDSNDRILAPFIMEKIFPNGGRLLLINAGDYFNSIFDSPHQYFTSLSNISDMLNTDLEGIKESQKTSIPKKGFIGNMEATGIVTLNSSSVSMSDEPVYPSIIKVQNINIINYTGAVSRSHENVIVRNLNLTGYYEAFIKFAGSVDVPEAMSNHDYISVNIPTEFNLTVNLPGKKHGTVEMIVQNKSSTESIKITDTSKIEFHNISAEYPPKFVHVVLKDPEMKVKGITKIKNALLHGYLSQKGDLNSGDPLNAKEVQLKFDFIEHYNEPLREGVRTKFITYLKSIISDAGVDQPSELKLPGDIPARAIEQGKNVPLIHIMTSFTGVIVLVGAIVFTLVVNVIYKMNKGINK